MDIVTKMRWLLNLSLCVGSFSFKFVGLFIGENIGEYVCIGSGPADKVIQLTFLYPIKAAVKLVDCCMP